MEAVGAFLEEEWESLSRMFSSEEADFVAHLQGHDKRDNNSFIFGTSSPTVWPIDDEANYNVNTMYGVDESFLYSSDTLGSNFHYFSQESSNSSGSNNVFFPTPSQENHCFSDSNQETNNSLQSMDFGAMDMENNNSSVPFFPDNDVMGDILYSKEEIGSDNLGNKLDGQPAIAGPGNDLPQKRKIDAPKISSDETPKKKSRVSKDAQKGKKNTTSKKNQKLTKNGSDEEETNNGGTNGQSSSCYSSEDDSNASHELKGGTNSDSKGPSAALNSNGKTRASRGAATDPQSLYARRRRERINERLRILQNLVPNGTKVDISTMLEEAVHYVKFLQLQIKLLSSDDMWMYAPIAYNGMDIGLYSKISPTL
ncbi:transcription factor bHLH85-like [Camellia sinensis]|uniref:BHLH domain-containing protein n=1 Tax=Camellia sinensis var. sinensis TaxID=542762 RepID=A0A4V3WQM1_CAMSN|nr:transcription factor bHLH85-like [Camellia sinensis]THG20827.1 hypothetical protein TEA_016264 [Camellia sinensis var. sinensis]